MPKTFPHNKILLRFLRPALIAWAVVAMRPCPALAQRSWAETDTLECINRFQVGSTVIEPDSVPLSAASQQEFSPGSYYRKGYFALKTNLLMDVLTVLNAELEMPIGKHWSGMVEWTFPFWRWERKQYCEEVLMWNVELRKWFAPVPKTATCHPMRGLFVGAYAGSAVFDVEINKKGYKSKSSLSAGLTVGISKYIGRDWRLEFSAGAGLFTAEVMEYDAKYSEIDNKWHSVWQRNRRFTWIGPTKLKISISWYPQFKHRLKYPDVDRKGGDL